MLSCFISCFYNEKQFDTPLLLDISVVNYYNPCALDYKNIYCFSSL